MWDRATLARESAVSDATIGRFERYECHRPGARPPSSSAEVIGPFGQILTRYGVELFVESKKRFDNIK